MISFGRPFISVINAQEEIKRTGMILAPRSYWAPSMLEAELPLCYVVFIEYRFFLSDTQ